MFSHISDEDLLNVVLFTPPHKMCDDGYPSRSRHYAVYGYSFVDVSQVRENKLRYDSEHEHTYCKKEEKEKIEEMIKDFKGKGIKCRRYHNLRDFDNTKEQLSYEIYKRNGHCWYV